METTKLLNVHQKLATAREDLLDLNIKKSGQNDHKFFEYFKLEDIIPPITRIFKKLGLLAIYNLQDTRATLKITNTENPNEEILFEMPIGDIQGSVIVSKQGKSDPLIQTYGSIHTYTRRYLYMQALDIIEHDEKADIDKNLGASTDTNAPVVPTFTATTTAKYTAPKSPEQRTEIVKEITGANDEATEKQKTILKQAMAELLKISNNNPTYDKAVQGIMLATENLTKISTTVCLEKIETVNALIAKEKGN